MKWKLKRNLKVKINKNSRKLKKFKNDDGFSKIVQY